MWSRALHRISAPMAVRHGTTMVRTVRTPRSRTHRFPKEILAMARKPSSKLHTRNAGNGRAVVSERGAPVQRARAANLSKASDLAMEQVSQEILRLVEAARQGRLDERGKIDQF